MEIYNYKGHQINYRPGTYDLWIINEILKKNEYKIDLNPGDVVLDAGANIGIFTIYAALKGVKEIHCFECDVNNWQLLVDNTESLPNVTLYPFALFRDEIKSATFRMGTDKNHGNGSLLKRKCGTLTQVSTLAFNDVVEEILPTKIKIDIEGSEFYLFNYDLDLPDSILQMEFEIHNMGRKTANLYNRLESYLLNQNFTISKPANFGNKKLWYTKILCTKM